ncbi:MAG: hypothetical protein ACJ76N_03450 [Thermoanaerobaculia bacterium]
MFVIDCEYTRDEIHTKIGGSKQAYLPTYQGVVVAACLTKGLNPQAPQVILCGKGKRTVATGALLAGQGGVIPVFIKRAVNRWVCQGKFKAVASFVSGPEFDKFIAASDRPASDISRAVVLEATV